MREYLYRAKRKDNKEWIYGSLVHQTDFYGNKCDRYFIIDGTSTQDYDIGDEYEVIPETVGQYIGIEDFYEGDVLSFVDELEVSDYHDKITRVGMVIFENGSFAIKDINFIKHYRWMDYDCKKIGNIYD